MTEATTEPQSIALKIDKNYPFRAKAEITSILVIGAGGTGSYVVPGLAREVFTMTKRPQMVLCDGDIVEEKNLKRQHFIASDIGQNKAKALADRYSAAFGLTIGYRDEFITTKEGFGELIRDGKGPTIIITCVDNIKTRMLIREAIAEHDGHDVYWIDCGNEDVAGQVVLSARCPWWKMKEIEGGRYPMPDVFDIYPELLERPDKLPTEMSCAELAASSPQYGFVNLTAATLALNYAHDLIQKEPIRTNVAEFSIKNKFMHRPLTESRIQAWKGFFNKFEKFNYFEDKKKADEAKKELQAKIEAEKVKRAKEAGKDKPDEEASEEKKSDEDIATELKR